MLFRRFSPRWVVLAACLLAVASAPFAGDDRSVRTDRPGARPLPLPKGDDVFHFVIFGDRTGGVDAGLEVLEQAVVDTNLLDPDLVLTVGDLVDGYNDTPDWLRQTRDFLGVMKDLRMPWFPVAGNHDIYYRGDNKPEGEHEANYEKHFGPLWYWFEHKKTGFLVLYTDEGNLETGEKGYSRPDLVQMSRVSSRGSPSPSTR